MKEINEYLIVNFCEQNLIVKTLVSVTEKQQAYKFRKTIFIDELNWVKDGGDEFEIDEYDNTGTIPLGVFEQTGRMIAHLRITLPQHDFMMEKEFSVLIDTPIHKTDYAIEISRVCTCSDTRNIMITTSLGSYHISMLLYKGLYEWCCKNHIHTMYMVIEYKLFRLLKLSGFPCKKIGKIVLMPDGVSAISVKINWREFEKINSEAKPQLLSWFSNVESINCAA
ncbi:MAG: N-acyl-L-homoserine lactone synthetase [Patescibacteria group bacterium]|jgi:N-acyl-L-homoserine lactone synthetase|nr:N-acyl-L-homoserine lactone synthetase [Patescibacteria group bacterium]